MPVKEPFLLLMPSYNQAHYIADAVRSVLAQDDPDWELWIVDNSSDNTPQVMSQFVDPRIRFHHIPQRMDPGTCLNWMLERAVGRYFSYIHTDNNLGSQYVSSLRAELAGRPLGLAYCDMRVIDDAGKYIGVFRRGKFDLTRLISADTLGVPFAATTQLAREMGGFSVRDFADDVRFCVSAYGLAEYVHVPTPLLDYRLHAQSRTEDAGGGHQMQRIFAELMPKIVPVLEQRGVRPVGELERAIKSGLDDVDWFVEDHWHRKISKWTDRWWEGPPSAEQFFFAGLLDIPGFSSKLGRPPRSQFIRDSNGKIRVMPWTKRTIRHYLRQYRDDLHRLFRAPHHMLLTWGGIRLSEYPSRSVAFRIESLDFRTLWAARQFEVSLGWRPLISAGIADPPTWLRWGSATGTEPLLNCKGDIQLSAMAAEK
jgi:glycosyltransferase involved in cell wall biosynthesis